MRRTGRRQFFRAAAGTAFLATAKDAVTTVPGVQPASVTRVMPDQAMQRLGFERYDFSDGVYSHAVYAKGAGPTVVVMHELPGFDDAAVHFIDRLVERGFRVHAPHLYGPPLWSEPTLNYVRLCISKEFGYLAANRSAPICDWLRALVRSLSESEEETRIGVIGLCLTGAFVIPMVIEPGVRAGVISQPAIPLSLRYVVSKGKCGAGPWMAELNVSDADLDAATRRCARDGVPILVQRFTDDLLSTSQRVERIAHAFGKQGTLAEYAASGEHPHPHALMTIEYDQARDVDPADPHKTNSTRVALQSVVEFLHANLDVQKR